MGGTINQTGLRTDANKRKEKQTVYNTQKGRLTKVHRKFDRLYYEYTWEDFNNIAKEIVGIYEEVKKSFTEYYTKIRSIEEREKAQTDFTQRSTDAMYYMQLVDSNRMDPTRPGYQPDRQEDPSEVVNRMIEEAKRTAATKPAQLNQTPTNQQEEVQENQTPHGQVNQLPPPGQTNQQPPFGPINQNLRHSTPHGPRPTGTCIKERRKQRKRRYSQQRKRRHLWQRKGRHPRKRRHPRERIQSKHTPKRRWTP